MTDRLAEIRAVLPNKHNGPLAFAAHEALEDLQARLAACELEREELFAKIQELFAEIHEKNAILHERYHLLAACEQEREGLEGERNRMVRALDVLGEDWAYENTRGREAEARLAACEQERERLLRAVGGPRWEQAEATETPE